MKYLVDSDWVADYLRGRPDAVTLLSRLFRQGIALSVITVGEIYEGVYYGRDPRQNEAVFRRFLRGVRVLPVTRPIALRFARIRGALRAQGRIVAQPDLLIAATAMHHNLTLVTRNTQHFRRISGLTLYRTRQ